MQNAKDDAVAEKRRMEMELAADKKRRAELAREKRVADGNVEEAKKRLQGIRSNVDKQRSLLDLIYKDESGEAKDKDVQDFKQGLKELRREGIYVVDEDGVLRKIYPKQEDLARRIAAYDPKEYDRAFAEEEAEIVNLTKESDRIAANIDFYDTKVQGLKSEIDEATKDVNLVQANLKQTKADVQASKTTACGRNPKSCATITIGAAGVIAYALVCIEATGNCFWQPTSPSPP